MVTLWVPTKYFIDRRRLTSSLVPFFVRYCYVDSRLVDTHVKFHGAEVWLEGKGAGGAEAPRNLSDQLTLFKPGGQIMSLTLLPAPWIQKAIYTSAVGAG